jgi:L-gulonate 5-dehydrogenase
MDDILKAITVIKPNQIEMLEVEKPSITSPDQVLVRIRATGICGSDVHVAHGTNPYAVYPRVIGHEASGTVEEVGDSVSDLNPGDGVVFEPITYCGTCYACRTGHHNVCRELKVLGCSVDGTFREYAVVGRSQLYKYHTDKMSFVQAAACEPYTIGAQANWRGNVQPGDVVLVHGAGPIGLVVADVAKSRGATVIVSEPNENRLAMAKAFGADYLINPMKEDLDALIGRLTGGEGVNVIFEAAGVPELLTHAVEVLSPAGRLVAMTFGKEPIPVNFRALNAKELTILGTRHQFQKFPETVEQFPGRLDRVNQLITHMFPAAEFKKAFDVLADKNGGAAKVVLTFG